MARMVAEFVEGEAFRADKALAHGEERAREAAEERAEREGRELGVGGVDAERSARDLVLAQRFPRAPDRQAAKPQRHEIGDQRERQDHIIEEQLAVDRRVFHPEIIVEAAGAVSKHEPEERDLRDRADAGAAAGERAPVDEDGADDLAEGERHDREIVAAQSQHREAEDHAPQRRQNAGDRQADPERQMIGRRQQRVGIGADCVEGDVAEIQQAGEADDDVEAPAQHHIDQDLDAVAVDPFERAAGAERQDGDRREKQQEQQADDRDGHRGRRARRLGDRRRALALRRGRIASARRSVQRRRARRIPRPRPDARSGSACRRWGRRRP